MEQRYDAVLGVIRDGYSVSEVALAYGVSRQSVHAWLAPFEKGGLSALADQSHNPRSSPFQMSASIGYGPCGGLAHRTAQDIGRTTAQRPDRARDDLAASITDREALEDSRQ